MLMVESMLLAEVDPVPRTSPSKPAFVLSVPAAGSMRTSRVAGPLWLVVWFVQVPRYPSYRWRDHRLLEAAAVVGSGAVEAVVVAAELEVVVARSSARRSSTAVLTCQQHDAGDHDDDHGDAAAAVPKMIRRRRRSSSRRGTTSDLRRHARSVASRSAH
jgi:hypothetical protein